MGKGRKKGFITKDAKMGTKCTKNNYFSPQRTPRAPRRLWPVFDLMDSFSGPLLETRFCDCPEKRIQRTIVRATTAKVTADLLITNEEDTKKKREKNWRFVFVAIREMSESVYGEILS
jgi:hypothetical protein